MPNPRAVTLFERDRRAMRLRTAGLPWDEIAIECGFVGKTPAKAAQMAVLRLMRKYGREDTDAYREFHVRRLEALLRAMWVAATNPEGARKAAKDAGAGDPIDQSQATARILTALDQLAKVHGLYAPVEISGPAGGPIQGHVDVMHWRPDEAFMAQYARVLREAGILDDDEPEIKLVGPGAGDPDMASE